MEIVNARESLLRPNRFQTVLVAYDGLDYRDWTGDSGPLMPPGTQEGDPAEFADIGSRNLRPRDTEEERAACVEMSGTVYWRKPDCWRDDLVFGRSTVVTVLRPGAKSSYSSSESLEITNNMGRRTLWSRITSSLLGSGSMALPSTIEQRVRDTVLLDLGHFSAGWCLTEQEDTTCLGRAASVLFAERLERASGGTPLDQFDNYKLVLDRERGILLQVVALDYRGEFLEWRVRDVQFDCPLADDVFDFKVPPGTRRVLLRE